VTDDDADDDDDATEGRSRSVCTLLLPAFTCVACEWVLGSRAGTLPCAGTRAHGAVSGWAQAGPQSRGGGILAGRCKGKGFAWIYRCSEVPRL
jgi:hypothetical protein